MGIGVVGIAILHLLRVASVHSHALLVEEDIGSVLVIWQMVRNVHHNQRIHLSKRLTRQKPSQIIISQRNLHNTIDTIHPLANHTLIHEVSTANIVSARVVERTLSTAIEPIISIRFGVELLPGPQIRCRNSR